MGCYLADEYGDKVIKPKGLGDSMGYVKEEPKATVGGK